MARENLRGDAPAFRHAVRLAVAVLASALLASWLSLPRGYWVPFAVAVILKPDYSTLFSRGVGRIIGTMLGATLAAILVSGLHPGLILTAVLVVLTCRAPKCRSWRFGIVISQSQSGDEGTMVLKRHEGTEMPV